MGVWKGFLHDKFERSAALVLYTIAGLLSVCFVFLQRFFHEKKLSISCLDIFWSKIFVPRGRERKVLCKLCKWDIASSLFTVPTYLRQEEIV